MQVAFVAESPATVYGPLENEAPLPRPARHAAWQTASHPLAATLSPIAGATRRRRWDSAARAPDSCRLPGDHRAVARPLGPQFGAGPLAAGSLPASAERTFESAPIRRLERPVQP